MINTQAAQVVLVTGAARRLGAAIARELHAAGWNVLIHYQSSAADARLLVAELNAQRAASACALRANLLDARAIRTLAQRAHAQWKRLDALVNNASTYFPTPLKTMTLEQANDLIGSNLRAPLLLTQACAALMREGSVINLIDVHARKAQPGFAAYTATKAGLWSLTESLALELAPRIRVNAVAPGHMLPPAGASRKEATALAAAVPLKRWGGAEPIAYAVKFLLSAEAAYINGAIIPVDGGLSLC